MTTDSLIEQLLNLHPHCDMTGVQRDAYGIARSDAIAIARRHLEGRPAVPGKPLELQTRDELLAYIRGREEWQPIETAPKDGRYIRLWPQDMDARWGTLRKNECWHYTDDRMNSSEVNGSPTHWFEFPKQPATKE